MGVAYLKKQLGSGWNGGYIEVEFQAGRMTIESLLEIIESALLGTIATASHHHHLQPIHFRRRLVDTNLALGHPLRFLPSPGALLSVMTLWMLNVRHMRPTIRALRDWGQPHLLYSPIALLTLLSLSFIASGIMYWMFEFWPRHVKQFARPKTAKFLAGLKRCPRSVWVDREGTEMEVD